MSEQHHASPRYRAKLHLVFACIALLQAPLSANGTKLVRSFVSPNYPWSVELELISRLLPLCFVALLAWLAFERFGTNSGVTLLPARWADVGVLVPTAYVIRETVQTYLLSRNSPARLGELKMKWIATYVDYDGSLLVGWVVLAVVAIAFTEELVYRAFLLRALEGFVDRWSALVLHAVVFELVHVFVYGLGFKGGVWFIAALIYGYAFQRTRSLAVPVILHAGANFFHHSSIWLLAP
jgi:membrane protease YdiL (CAAX protease family)